MPAEGRSRAGRDHWFFLTGMRVDRDKRVDLTPISHQLRNVLRLRLGSLITLLDGSGAAYQTRIEALDAERATGRVVGKESVQSEPNVSLTLYQCVLKRERFEWVLQKGTELGVSRFVPVISSRTVVRPADRLLPKYERWRTIVREAAEQCRRGRLPSLGDPLSWDQAVDQAAGLRFLAWEEANGASSVWRPTVSKADEVSLLVGPEGGISRQEAAEATIRGWLPMSLGPRILRAETAAVAAATIVLHIAGELG